MHNEKSSKKTESLLAPLEYLTFHKEATIEEIAKQTNKNYSTILRATSELCEKRLATYRLERTAPRGKELRKYTISFYGLVFYLLRSPSAKLTVLEIREIAKTHEDMLLVFKKWDRFVKAGCEQELHRRFLEALNVEYNYNVERYAAVMISTFNIIFRKEDENLRRSAFDGLVLGFFYLDHPVESVKEFLGTKNWSGLEKIWQVVEDDYDLRKKRDAFLEFIIIEHNEGLKAISEWRKHFQQDKNTTNVS